MKCPYCMNEETSVKDTRLSDNGFIIKRKRICSNCNAKFVTVERILKKEIYVIKNNNDRVLFDVEKIKNSISSCIAKKLDSDRIDEISKNITERIEASGVDEIKTSTIAEIVMDYLERIDKVALIRYASVHMKFEDPNDFSIFIKKIES